MVTKERDEELALFLEMRRRDNDKDKAQNDFLENSDCRLDACLGTFNPRGSLVSNIPPRKTAAEKFLDSENDKSEYDWLLTPPRTPSLEMEPRKNAMSQNGMPNACVTALKTRLTNIQEEPASRTNIGSKRITLPSALNSSNCTNRKPSSTSATRPATPTRRATLPTTKPSRSSTPTSRAPMPSSKPGPVRSSTPTRNITRSSTPVGRPSLPALKSAARSSTPTRQMSTPASAPSMAASARGRSASVTRSASSTLKNPVPLRSNSPAKKSTPMKPYEIPGFSLDAPPNLRTSLPERPSSASRGRPGGTNARSSYVETGSKGRLRQQSCSPARGRAPNSSANGGRISIPSKSRTLSNGSDDVNPVLMGTKMVERVVNMRKLAPPKQEDQHSSHNSSCGLDSTGFGRTLSKKSLDMALRHMDIRRSVSGKLRPLTSIPSSSVYSVRSGGSTKSKTDSFLDSPLATSSNSSEISVNNSHFFDRTETEVNDYGSEGGNTSPISQSGK